MGNEQYALQTDLRDRGTVPPSRQRVSFDPDKNSSAEIDRRKRPLPAPIRFDKIEPYIKSWDVAQRQPADPGKVALRKEDVAEPAIRRIKPRASFPEGGPTRSADQNSR
jgi:hypothetical protein